MQLRIARVLSADAAPRNFALQLVFISPGTPDPESIVILHDYGRTMLIDQIQEARAIP
jgi:hypothetical protein